jgi:hypothetical protein
MKFFLNGHIFQRKSTKTVTNMLDALHGIGQNCQQIYQHIRLYFAQTAAARPATVDAYNVLNN